MKTVLAHEADAVVDPNGTVRIEHVPFAAGERVRVVVLEWSKVTAPRHGHQDVERSRAIRQQRRGSVLRYERPDEPVGVEDWEALADEDRP